jgi:hypothetical protein
MAYTDKGNTVLSSQKCFCVNSVTYNGFIIKIYRKSTFHNI